MRRRFVMIGLVACVLSTCPTAPVLAAEGGFFNRIGSAVGVVVMPLILVVSLAMVYFVLEGFFLLRRSALLPAALIGRVNECFRQGKLDQALELCRADESLFARMVRAGLGKMSWGHDEMIKAMEAAGQEVSVGLYHRIGNLSLIASVAPMLGLLGTVTGMIVAFGDIVTAQANEVTPALVADGIGQALNTTAAGLLVAIPAVIAYNYFRDYLTRTILEAEALGEEIMLPFKSVEPEDTLGSDEREDAAPEKISRVRIDGRKK